MPTAIPYVHETWNPWQGCTRHSEGCDHCYMYRDMPRFGNDPAAVRRSSWGTFSKPLRFAPGIRVLTCSWSDYFHPDADAWRDDAWRLIRSTPGVTYLVLTKRIERVPDHLPRDWGRGYPNVWLGVTVESQARAYRIELLCRIPAALRWVSVEPMLNHVELYPWLAMKNGIRWVVCGGESGSQARPAPCELVRDLVGQCVSSHVPIYFKQWGTWLPGGQEESYRGGRLESCVREEFVLDWFGARVPRWYYRAGSVYSGAKLDGVDWCELPKGKA